MWTAPIGAGASWKAWACRTRSPARTAGKRTEHERGLEEADSSPWRSFRKRHEASRKRGGKRMAQCGTQMRDRCSTGVDIAQTHSRNGSTWDLCNQLPRIGRRCRSGKPPPSGRGPLWQRGRERVKGLQNTRAPVFQDDHMPSRRSVTDGRGLVSAAVRTRGRGPWPPTSFRAGWPGFARGEERRRHDERPARGPGSRRLSPGRRPRRRRRRSRPARGRSPSPAR
jgi:hypothetical protein